MAHIEITLVKPEYGFEARDESGMTINMDNSPEGGGQGFGVRPMQNVLMALGGCSAIDIVSILKKQRQSMTSLQIFIDGQREQDKVPALWEKVHLVFRIGGQVDLEKAKSAARLSVEKYCSVAETLRRAGCVITWDAEIAGEE